MPSAALEIERPVTITLQPEEACLSNDRSGRRRAGQSSEANQSPLHLPPHGTTSSATGESALFMARPALVTFSWRCILRARWASKIGACEQVGTGNALQSRLGVGQTLHSVVPRQRLLKLSTFDDPSHIAVALGTFSDQQQVTALEAATKVGDGDLMTTCRTPDVG